MCWEVTRELFTSATIYTISWKPGVQPSRFASTDQWDDLRDSNGREFALAFIHILDNRASPIHRNNIRRVKRGNLPRVVLISAFAKETIYDEKKIQLLLKDNFHHFCQVKNTSQKRYVCSSGKHGENYATNICTRDTENVSPQSLRSFLTIWRFFALCTHRDISRERK